MGTDFKYVHGWDKKDRDQLFSLATGNMARSNRFNLQPERFRLDSTKNWAQHRKWPFPAFLPGCHPLRPSLLPVCPAGSDKD